jgi:UDP-GlcNAc3NAcA epimerase
MKVASIVGARPQFIKCAPVSRELRKVATEVLIHTGQHYDDNMSAVFFHDLDIPQPDYNLGVGSAPQGAQTGEMLKRIEAVLSEERPDYVLVYGDTNSTLAGALAAAKLHLPVAHVEAGLRSFNRGMPEEINRVVTDHLSMLLFCPTKTAVDNLAREGITKGVHLVGDVMYDALCDNIEIAERTSKILEQLELDPREYLLATVHRAENTDQTKNLHNIVSAFVALAESGQRIVFAVHPRTRKRLDTSDGKGHPNLRLIDPVSYLDMLILEKHARVILTDSGGVQKEAFWFRTPCVTLRDETEWVETVESGWNVLVGTHPEAIVEAAEQVKVRDTSINPYPDRALVRVVETLVGCTEVEGEGRQRTLGQGFSPS